MKLITSVLIFLMVSIDAFAQNISHLSWDRMLGEYVLSINEGASTGVDYEGFLKDRKKLKSYLDLLSAVQQEEFDTWAKPEQLAFLINAYNAWTVELILTKYPDLESIKDLGSIFKSPWKKKFVVLLGETRSLDDIEHNLIRGSGRYNEPRIHFAVNCASIGCPALRSEAYQGEKLEEQLEEATNSFLSDISRNRIRDDELHVSSIFKWYRDDFESAWRGGKSLEEFLLSYKDALGLSQSQATKLKNNQIDIEYLDYDWRLNKAED
ncbi:DUF547 domain-containing protein [Aurantivibrio infirmus]